MAVPNPAQICEHFPNVAGPYGPAEHAAGPRTRYALHVGHARRQAPRPCGDPKAERAVSPIRDTRAVGTQAVWRLSCTRCFAVPPSPLSPAGARGRSPSRSCAWQRRRVRPGDAFSPRRVAFLPAYPAAVARRDPCVVVDAFCGRERLVGRRPTYAHERQLRDQGMLAVQCVVPPTGGGEGIRSAATSACKSLNAPLRQMVGASACYCRGMW